MKNSFQVTTLDFMRTAELCVSEFLKEKRVIDSADTSSGCWTSMFIHDPLRLLKALQKNNISSLPSQ